MSEDLFNKVQEKLAKNKKAPARHKAEESYLLTTKLYCGKCGALMFGESGVSHTGKMYTYYKCAAAKKKKTCDKKAVRKQWLEDLVVNETMCSRQRTSRRHSIPLQTATAALARWC